MKASAIRVQTNQSRPPSGARYLAKPPASNPHTSAAAIWPPPCPCPDRPKVRVRCANTSSGHACTSSTPRTTLRMCRSRRRNACTSCATRQTVPARARCFPKTRPWRFEGPFVVLVFASRHPSYIHHASFKNGTTGTLPIMF